MAARSTGRGTGRKDPDDTASERVPGTRGGPNGTRPRKTTAKARAREADIYAAAARIFHRKGYAATSLQDIADEVGILKGSLYYYIDSKEDLLYRITRSVHDDAIANLEIVRNFEGTPQERLRLLLGEHLRQFGRNLSMIRVFYTEYSVLSEERRIDIQHDRETYEAATLALIEEGKRVGEFCPDLNSTIECNAALTMVNSVHMWFRADSGPDIDQIADECTEFIIRGLSCPVGHDHRGV